MIELEVSGHDASAGRRRRRRVFLADSTWVPERPAAGPYQEFQRFIQPLSNDHHKYHAESSGHFVVVV